MLKKNVTISALVAFLLSFSVSAAAQVQVGPKAGANLNHTKFQDLKTYHPGFHLGVFVSYPLTDFLAVNAEVTYSQIGGGYDSGYYYVRPEIFRQNVNVTFHTVAAPLFVSATLPSLSQSKVRPMLLLGAEYAYAFRKTESYDNVYRLKGEDFVSKGHATTTTAELDAHHPALLFGGGVATTVFGVPATIDIRYKTTFNKSGIPNGTSERLKMLSVNVGVTVFNF